MPVQFTPGAMFKVPVGSDDFAYSVMLSKHPYIAFFGKDAVLDGAGSPMDAPMFITFVTKRAYSTGGWGKPIRVLPESAIPAIPRFFRQSITNKAECRIIEADGRGRNVTPSDCIGIEPEAIWTAELIEARLADAYAGRPNVTVEWLRPKV